MDIGKLGVWFFLDTMATTDAVAFVQRLEALGYPALWLPEAVGREAFAQAGVVLGRTERIVIATGIANIWARDPVAMAAGQKTLAEASGGRFLLGIGVSHAPLVEGVRGHAYRRPLTAMREYLARMETSPFMAVGPSDPPEDDRARRRADAGRPHVLRPARAHGADARGAPERQVDLRRAGRHPRNGRRTRAHGSPPVHAHLRADARELHREPPRPRLGRRRLRGRVLGPARRRDRGMGRGGRDLRPLPRARRCRRDARLLPPDP